MLEALVLVKKAFIGINIVQCGYEIKKNLCDLEKKRLTQSNVAKEKEEVSCREANINENKRLRE